MPTELIEHLSGALIVSDITPEEALRMAGVSDSKLVAEAVKKEMKKIEPGTGRIFGAFHSDTEAMKFRRQVSARARDLKWYEDYGQRTQKGSWKTPYKAETSQIKNIDLEKHKEFAGQDDELYVVWVYRFPFLQAAD